MTAPATRVTIRAVTAGASDLATRTPVSAMALNQLPAEQGDLHYWCARLDEPLRYHYPAQFDVSRCQPDYLDRDEAGPFLWILVIVVCLRPYGTELASNMSTTEADLAYVIDNSLGYDVYLDRAKVDFVGTAEITTSSTTLAHQEPTSAATDGSRQDTHAEPSAAPAAPIFLDPNPQHPPTERHDDGDEIEPREPLARNVDEFHTHLYRLVNELTGIAGRHPGLGPLLPREFTPGTDTTEQAAFNLDNLPLKYRSWEPRAGWITRSTNDFDELLYWIIDDMARMLAWRLTVNAPSYAKVKATRAQSMLFFPYWRALVFALDPHWGEQTAATIGELILSRGQNPGPEADHYFDALNDAAAAADQK